MTPEQVERCVEVIERTVKQLEADMNVIAGQRDVITVQRSEIQNLNGVIMMLMRYVQAVELHNSKCERECSDGANCGYEGFLRRTKRRCAGCPMHHKIDVMPTQGSA